MGRPVDDDEPASPYFGDYPDGAYWSAVPGDESGDAGSQRSLGQPDHVPRWDRSSPRTPVNPYPIRMFAEIGCNFALWGEIDEPPPTRRRGVDESATLEEQLPISDSLRRGLLSWAADYFQWDGGDKTIPIDDFDEHGFASAVSSSANWASCTPSRTRSPSAGRIGKPCSHQSPTSRSLDGVVGSRTNWPAKSSGVESSGWQGVGWSVAPRIRRRRCDAGPVVTIRRRATERAVGPIGTDASPRVRTRTWHRLGWVPSRIPKAPGSRHPPTLRSCTWRTSSSTPPTRRH